MQSYLYFELNNLFFIKVYKCIPNPNANNFHNMPIMSCVCVCVVADCLYFISKALEKDHCYTKGLVLKEKIFEEQPCLKRDTMQMFTKW